MQYSTSARKECNDIPARLAPADVKTFELVACGFSNKEIAQRMYVSETLVKRRVSRVLKYFGRKSRAALMASLIDPDKLAAALAAPARNTNLRKHESVWSDAHESAQQLVQSLRAVQTALATGHTVC